MIVEGGRYSRKPRFWPLQLVQSFFRVLSFATLRPSVLFAWDSNVSGRSSGTSWLDGLRGIASLQVLFFHFFGRHIPYDRSFGSTPEDRYIFQLPFFRSIWGAGPSAVSVFFVISGCALTIKSLTLLRRKKYDDLYRSLCSSLIRRGVRLYLPLFLLAFPMLVLIKTVDMVRDEYIYSNEMKDSWFMQLVHLIIATDNHINPFMYPEHNPSNNRFAYIPASWTIPLEYHGSILSYLMVMVVSRIEIFRIRCIIIAGMAFYSLHRGSWWNSNFMVGMLLADFMLEQQSKEGNSTVRHNRVLTGIHKVCFYILFGCGFYLAGLPPTHAIYNMDPKPKPGYEFLYKLYPPQYLFQMAEDSRWYWYWSGTLTVVSISQIPRIRSVLETRLCQWLGKLSFSLYLVHGAVISALMSPLRTLISHVTENRGILCILEFSILAPLIFVLSGIVEKYIDQTSIKFAKKVEQYLWQEQPLRQEECPLASRDVEMM